MILSFKNRLLSALIAGAMTIAALPFAALHASAEGGNEGKYISEVFIAYGKDEAEAKAWLIQNGWEPVKGDFNAGKNSGYDDPVAAVMGVHRTNNADDAITDMAVMNMSGGYSFDDYRALLEEKKTSIDEFVDSFMPVIQEYRNNYNNKGSAAGKARADLVYQLLNQFYDGEIKGTDASYDTAMPMGDLFLATTRRELGEKEYDKLTENEKLQHGDLQQIILESSGAAMEAIEQALVLASDDAQTTWLERLTDLSGVDPVESIELFVPNTAGKNLAPSAARSLLKSTYGDAAAALAAQYNEIQQDLIWYESYRDNNGLLQGEDESDEDFQARLSAHFDALEEVEEGYHDEVTLRYTQTSLIYNILFETAYAGDWGATLGDFFYPLDESLSYQDDVDAFIPLAAALSKGQRAGLSFMTLRALLLVGNDDEEGVRSAMPKVEELLKDKEQISVYSGVNRAIFRDGVALTSVAMMQKNMGRSPYSQLWDEDGIVSIAATSGIILSSLLITAGAIALKVSSNIMKAIPEFTEGQMEIINIANKITSKENSISMLTGMLKADRTNVIRNHESLISQIGTKKEEVIKLEQKLCELKESENVSDVNALVQEEKEARQATAQAEKIGSAGRIVLAVGAILLIISIGVKIAQMYQYYNRDFTIIPSYIVDEADIVEYLKDEDGNPILDENGNQKKNITFDQYVYYEVVKCNRQAIGINDEAQDGVEDYKKWGCGDAADLNADIGMEWLALYTVKSPKKGNPILANSLKMQYGKSDQPAGTTQKLHYFCYSNAADIADSAYAYNHGKGGIYFFWSDDPAAYTASSFSNGQLALIGIGCFALGGLGGSLLTTFIKKRKETPEAPAAA